MEDSKEIHVRLAGDSVLVGSQAVRVENHPARPAYSISKHSHDFDSLCLVVAGRGHCVVVEQEYELEPMMALFLPAGTVHSLVDKVRSAMTVFVINFDQRISRQQAALLDTLRLHVGPRLLPVHVWQSLRLILRRMLHEQNVKPPHFELALHTLLISVFLYLSRAALMSEKQKEQDHNSSEQRVRWVLDHVANTYYQNHSLPAVAKTARLSQRRFSTLCKNVSGQSFVAYLNGMRMRRARRLLETTELPVAAVAFQVGFEELSTFYRAFRKHFGCSPRQTGQVWDCGS